jgi:hypothetical protein
MIIDHWFHDRHTGPKIRADVKTIRMREISWRSQIITRDELDPKHRRAVSNNTCSVPLLEYACHHLPQPPPQCSIKSPTVCLAQCIHTTLPDNQQPLFQTPFPCLASQILLPRTALILRVHVPRLARFTRHGTATLPLLSCISFLLPTSTRSILWRAVDDSPPCSTEISFGLAIASRKR